MKNHGFLHPEVSYLLSSLGHTDTVMICDAGFPIPQGANLIHLAVTKNLPTVLEVAALLKQEIVFEEVRIAEETKTVNSSLYTKVREKFAKQKWVEIPMRQFLTSQCYAYIRTGDVSPYANIQLVSASGVEAYYRKFLDE